MLCQLSKLQILLGDDSDSPISRWTINKFKHGLLIADIFGKFDQVLDVQHMTFLDYVVSK